VNGVSARCSIKRQAFPIIWSCGDAARALCGRQRRQGLKPAFSAASGTGKNITFSRRGRFDGHPGRQYTPVDRTA